MIDAVKSLAGLSSTGFATMLAAAVTSHDGSNTVPIAVAAIGLVGTALVTWRSVWMAKHDESRKTASELRHELDTERAEKHAAESALHESEKLVLLLKIEVNDCYRAAGKAAPYVLVK